MTHANTFHIPKIRIIRFKTVCCVFFENIKTWSIERTPLQYTLWYLNKKSIKKNSFVSFDCFKRRVLLMFCIRHFRSVQYTMYCTNFDIHILSTFAVFCQCYSHWKEIGFISRLCMWKKIVHKLLAAGLKLNSWHAAAVGDYKMAVAYNNRKYLLQIIALLCRW